MRLYAVLGEEFYSIGIMSPTEDGLCLRKKYSKNDLQKTPIDTCTRFEIMGSDDTPHKPEAVTKPEPQKTKEDSAWKPAEDPGSLFADPDLMETASAIKGGLVARNGDVVLFAIPISSEQPFPLMPVFRYGSSAMIEGKCCIVFQIKDGYLI